MNQTVTTVFNLCFLIQALGQIEGRLKLGKIIYLLEETGCYLGFSFENSHCGPWPSELPAALDWLETNGYITRKEVETEGYAGLIYQPVEKPPMPIDRFFPHHLKYGDLSRQLEILKSAPAGVLILASMRRYHLNKGLSPRRVRKILAECLYYEERYNRPAQKLLRDLGLNRNPSPRV
ncbi:MAG TPA: hypothetical protein VJK26_01060 [Patescibacteria group bacterium]|nr:hypothetical protein [Patescibacteria group bacterium]